MAVFDYFQQVELSRLESSVAYEPDQLGSLVQTGMEDLSGLDIVLFDVEEDRASIGNDGCAKGGYPIRKYLYQLYKGNYSVSIGDLGTIKAGSNITDTYFAVKEIVSFCLKQQVLPIIIGGSQDLVYASYLAYAEQEQTVNLVSIDSRFALGRSDDRILSNNFLGKIILHQPNVLFNYSNLGYQTYLVAQNELNLLEDLFFDSHRLGILKENIRVAEPVIRNADFINFNIGAVALPYAPANHLGSPNGFTGEQACQLCRYAGLSDKLSSFGIYEFNPSLIDQGLTAHLIAQMIWSFIDGFYHRKGDFPACNKKEYIKYTVSIEEGSREIVFYKSPKSDRWWMDVPYNSAFSKKYERHLMLPCDYDDYLTATEDELPERWFQTFKKLK
jgi:arginase family enzyme